MKTVSEEGFLFLTDRSDFWRSQKPIYVTRDEKDQTSARRTAASAKHRSSTAPDRNPQSRSKSAPTASKRISRAKSAPKKGKRQNDK